MTKLQSYKYHWFNYACRAIIHRIKLIKQESHTAAVITLLLHYDAATNDS